MSIAKPFINYLNETINDIIHYNRTIGYNNATIDYNNATIVLDYGFGFLEKVMYCLYIFLIFSILPFIATSIHATVMFIKETIDMIFERDSIGILRKQILASAKLPSNKLSSNKLPFNNINKVFYNNILDKLMIKFTKACVNNYSQSIVNYFKIIMQYVERRHFNCNDVQATRHNLCEIIKINCNYYVIYEISKLYRVFSEQEFLGFTTLDGKEPDGLLEKALELNYDFNELYKYATATQKVKLMELMKKRNKKSNNNQINENNNIQFNNNIINETESIIKKSSSSNDAPYNNYASEFSDEY